MARVRITPTSTQGDLSNTVRMHQTIIIGVVVVVVFGFAAILVTAGALVNDSLAEKKAISQDIRDEIQEQNEKIVDLTEQVQALNTKFHPANP